MDASQARDLMKLAGCGKYSYFAGCSKPWSDNVVNRTMDAMVKIFSKLVDRKATKIEAMKLIDLLTDVSDV